MGPDAGLACRACGYRSAKWLGRCPDCSAWGSFEAAPPAPAPGARTSVVQAFPDIPTREGTRLTTGLDEFDRVLGGGLLPGAVVLVGGEPGVGKSTLLLQTASSLAEGGRRVLYVSGEESAAQLRGRGERLGVASAALLVSAETDVERILEAAGELDPGVLIVDSIQAVRCTDLGAVPGSVGQVREAAARFVRHAKERSRPMLLVGHVTKDGTLAGPRLLEHVVDTILQFEGDRHHDHRMLRALKNRFGPTDELGVFRMTGRGLEQVSDPSEALLAQRADGVAGSALLAAAEGSRPLLLEVQALVGPPVQGSARRTVLGVDAGRVAMLLAVLELHTGVELACRDVFVNVTGGLSVSEPAADLAVAAAIVSAAAGLPLPPATVLAGEIGLTGEVRAVPRLEQRLREAARLGMRRAVTPAAGALASHGRAPERLAVRRVGEAVSALFGQAPLSPQRRSQIG